MKKLLMIALAIGFAGLSSAATVQWNFKSTATKFDSTSVGGNAKAYLIWIGSDSISTYSFAEYVNMTSSSEVDPFDTKVGKINAKVETDTTHVGNFVAVLSYVSEGKTYWNVSATEYSISEAQVTDLLENGTAIPDSSYSFSSSVSSGSGSVGGGWAQVPEPSTAALALAGLALLLKRRKA